jgi:hypothetical protein
VRQNVKTKTNETKCPMGARLRDCDKISKTYSAMIDCYVVQFRRSHCISPPLKPGVVCYFQCSDRLLLYYLVNVLLCYFICLGDVGIDSWMPLVVTNSLEKCFSNAENVVYQNGAKLHQIT